jgi:hypothetical protein
LTRFVFLAALALVATNLSAQQPRLVGEWRGVDRGANLTLVIHPNGQYSKTSQSGAATTQQTGEFRLTAPNRIVFSAAITAPNPPQAHNAFGHTLPMRPPLPLSSRNSIVFQAPNKIVVTDQMTHRSVTLVRMH